MLAIGAIVLLINKLNSKDVENKHLQSANDEKSAIITYHVNKEGRIVSEKDAAVLSAKDFARAYSENAKKLTEQMGIQTKDLKAYIDARIEAQGITKGTIEDNSKDTTSVYKWADRRAHLTDGFMSQDLYWKDGQPKIEGPYHYLDSLTFAMYTKKKWFMGSERLFGTGMLSNPKAKLTNSTAIKIDDYRDKRWVIGIGCSYDPITNQFRPSIFAGFKLIAF